MHNVLTLNRHACPPNTAQGYILKPFIIFLCGASCFILGTELKNREKYRKAGIFLFFLGIYLVALATTMGLTHQN